MTLPEPAGAVPLGLLELLNPPKQKRERGPIGERSLPAALDIDGPSSNTAFKAALADSTFVLHTRKLGFLPSHFWPNDSTFSDIVTRFFQRKNNANCRFPHKLYNALALVEAMETMWNLIGAKWVTYDVFKIDKFIFGRLLGIQSIDGGLFHRQGNFPSHGFAELTVAEVSDMKRRFALADDVDMERVRLLRHPSGGFTRESDEETVNRCRWGSS